MKKKEKLNNNPILSAISMNNVSRPRQKTNHCGSLFYVSLKSSAFCQTLLGSELIKGVEEKTKNCETCAYVGLISFMDYSHVFSFLRLSPFFHNLVFILICFYLIQPSLSFPGCHSYSPTFLLLPFCLFGSLVIFFSTGL